MTHNMQSLQASSTPSRSWCRSSRRCFSSRGSSKTSGNVGRSTAAPGTATASASAPDSSPKSSRSTSPNENTQAQCTLLAVRTHFSPLMQQHRRHVSLECVRLENASVCEPGLRIKQHGNGTKAVCRHSLEEPLFWQLLAQ